MFLQRQPELDGFDVWEKKAEDLKQMGFYISVNDFKNKISVVVTSNENI